MRVGICLAGLVCCGCGGYVVNAVRPPLNLHVGESADLSFADIDPGWTYSVKFGSIQPLTSHSLRYTAPAFPCHDLLNVNSVIYRTNLLSQDIDVHP